MYKAVTLMGVTEHSNVLIICQSKAFVTFLKIIPFWIQKSLPLNNKTLKSMYVIKYVTSDDPRLKLQSWPLDDLVRSRSDFIVKFKILINSGDQSTPIWTNQIVIKDFWFFFKCSIPNKNKKRRTPRIFVYFWYVSIHPFH